MPWKPDYISLTDVKGYLRISDNVDDTELGVWITAASRAIDTYCNRQFGQLAAPAARVYRRPPYWNDELQMWVVEVDDFQTLTGMTIAQGTAAAVAYASSGAVALPDNAPADTRPWTALGFATCPTMPLTSVSQWGWSAQPAQVGAAARLQVNRWNSRRDSPYGVTGTPSVAGGGGELRMLAKLDPDVKTSLAGLTRRRRAG